MKTTSQTLTPEGIRVIHLPNGDSVRADVITTIRRIDGKKARELGGGFPPRVLVDTGGDKVRYDTHVLLCESDDEMNALADELTALWTAVAPERVVLNREDSTRFAEALLKAGPFPIEPLPGPALSITPDGHVIQFGAITAPDGCYLLAAGEVLQEGDLSFISYGERGERGEWESITSGFVAALDQYTYARKLPEKGGQ